MRTTTTQPWTWLIGAAAAALGLTLSAAPVAAQADPPDPDDVVRRQLLVVDGAGERLDEGGSATPFRFELEGEDECPGDSAHDQYRVDSYLVPVGVEPSELLFAGQGPISQVFRAYDGFQMPLHKLNDDPYAAELTDQQREPGGPGPIPELPELFLGVYVPTPGIDDYDGGLPAGEYRMGLACTFAGRMTNLWETTVELTPDPSDEPVGIAWTITGPQPTDLEAGGASARSNGPVYVLLGVGALMAVIAAALFASSRRARAAAVGSVAVLGLAGYAIATTAPPAAADDRPQGELTLEPATVDAPVDAFALRLPEGGGRCEEDGTGRGRDTEPGPRTGADNWRWHAFIVEAGRDLSTLEFGPYGPGDDFDAADGEITASLFLAGGEPLWQQLPGIRPEGFINPDRLDGIVLDPAIYTLADGDYELGMACTDSELDTRQWWSVTVTVATGGRPFLTTAPAEVPPGTTDPADVEADGRGQGSDDPTDAVLPAPGPAGPPPDGGGDVLDAQAVAAPSSIDVAPPATPTGITWSPLLGLVEASAAVPPAAWAVLAAMAARIAYLSASPVRSRPPDTP